MVNGSPNKEHVNKEKKEKCMYNITSTHVKNIAEIQRSNFKQDTISMFTFSTQQIQV